jgi:hypothetical protein
MSCGILCMWRRRSATQIWYIWLYICSRRKSISDTKSYQESSVNHMMSESPVNLKALPVTFHTTSASDIYSRPVAGSLSNHHKQHIRFMYNKGSRPKIPFTSWYSTDPTSPSAGWVYLFLTLSSVAPQLISPLLRVEYFRFEH